VPLHFDNSLRLPAEEFFPAPQTKSGICLHHTVGGTASSSIHHWKSDNSHVGTAYMIGRDGTIFEIFDPKNWAFEFGLRGWPDAERFAFERRFIGIEIASEGGLIENDGKLYCFGTVSNRTWFSRDRAFDFGSSFRGFRYFAEYTDEQIASVIELVNHLCERFVIQRKVPAEFLKFYGRELKDFEGVIGHTHVRPDKTDPIPDLSFWQAVTDGCGLARIDVGSPTAAPETAASPPTGQVDLVTLFEDNIQEIAQMASMSGSMVKQLILELQQPGRDTYIRLHDAVPDGHTVEYELVQGNPSLVIGIAHALDVFEEVTPSKLVVLS
jgi:hypothetical protein